MKNAQFTGVAFAGSEALVAYNYQPSPTKTASPVVCSSTTATAGVSIRKSSRSPALPRSRRSPALPDGGVAVLAVHEGDARLYERESAGAPWREAATPLPSGVSGSLALYRQNGALRALLSTGGAALTASAVGVEPPPGFPPYEEPGATLASGGGSAGEVLRQTASGWRDERHSFDPVEENEKSYAAFDQPYRPDGMIAALVSPTGAEAWFVGGDTSEEEGLQTAVVARYPANERSPNERSAPVAVQPEAPGPADGGGHHAGLRRQRGLRRPMRGSGADPKDRARGVARQGGLAGQAGAGAAAFFYTGPLVHYSSYEGRVTPRPPYGEEYERYADIFSSGLPWPAYAGSSQGEGEGEAALAGAFAGLASPLGATPTSGFEPADSAPSRSEREACGCADGYYAVQNAHVMVVVLDDAGAGGVDAAQRSWLEQELQYAGTVGKPAIVVGEADLGAQLAPGKREAAAEVLFSALVGRNPDDQDPGGYAASAYFYDAREENVSKTISFAGASLRAFGSGTLGYEYPNNEATAEFHGAKGILFGEVLWSETGRAIARPCGQG